MEKNFSLYWDGVSFSPEWQKLNPTQKFSLLEENFFPEKEETNKEKIQKNAETLCQVLSTKEGDNPAVFQFSDEQTQDLLRVAFNAPLRTFRNLLFQKNQCHTSLWIHLSGKAAHLVVDMLQASRKQPQNPYFWQRFKREKER